MAGMQQMSNFNRQRGFTFWTIVLNVSLLAIALVLILRVLPNYMTYMTVKDVMQRAASEFKPREETMQDLRGKIQKLMTSSQVYVISSEDVRIYREKGTVFIDANYEARFPVVWIIEGVMVFDDLVFPAGPQGGN